MLMYHTKSKQPVDCHPSQVATMEAKGWKTKAPTKSPTTPAKAVEEKTDG